MRRIQVIVGSVRPVRIGDQIARWLVDAASGLPGLSFELIDLKDWHLPPDDEPHQPKHGGRYVQPHTRRWSETIAAGDGFILITPQYNWGYPAALKNALDHLYDEWAGKPAVIVSYGHRRGVKAAEQLKQVLLGLHMIPVPTMPSLFLKSEMLDAGGRLADPAGAFGAEAAAIREAVGEMAFKTVDA